MSTPAHVVINKRGTSNNVIKQLLESLLQKPLDIDLDLRLLDIIKLNRTLKMMKIETHFCAHLVLEFLAKTQFVEQNHNNHFTLAELSELLIEIAESKNSSTSVELNPLRENAIIQLKMFYPIFLNFLEEQNHDNITLSLYVKIINNVKAMCNFHAAESDQVFNEMLMDHVIPSESVNH